MLSKKQNDHLTRTNTGTPTGKLLRRYWIPALLSEEIPEADSPPVPVNLLGEELVAFRDSEGRIGLLDDHCAHRGTSLSYGRNEERGLRCIYHGWKFDVEGKVVDTPAEPAGSDFKKKIHHTAYPTHEAAGIVFAYMGPRNKVPLFPNYEWAQLPLSHTYVTKCLLECNYLQGLEGELDSAHISFVHRELGPERAARQYLFAGDTAPTYTVEETDFGMRLVATRKASEGKTYLRVSSFVMPVSCWVPARNKEVHIYVPADDTHAWRYDLGFFRERPVREEDVHRRKDIGPDYRRFRNMQNRYLQDRHAQKTENYTGMGESFLIHDACATETMGLIYNRTKEHLGVSDKALIAVRNLLLRSVKAVQEGKEPPHIVRDPEKNSFTQIDTLAEVIPGNTHWRQQFSHLTEPRSAKASIRLAAG